MCILSCLVQEQLTIIIKDKYFQNVTLVPPQQANLFFVFNDFKGVISLKTAVH